MGNQHPKKTTPTVLTNEEINMLKENTEFTEKEIREWHANFIRDCPTGRIDRKKFSEFYKQFCPDGKVESYCKHAFTTFDKNNDGAIDFEEFLLAIAATSQGSIDTRLAFAFDVYDISDDGLIDEAELTTIISAMFDLVGEADRKGTDDPKKLAENIIENLDLDGDKKLNKVEFINGCKNDKSLRRLLVPNI